MRTCVGACPSTRSKSHSRMDESQLNRRLFMIRSLLESLSSPGEVAPGYASCHFVVGQITDHERLFGLCFKIAHGFQEHAGAGLSAIVHSAEMLSARFGVRIADVEPAFGDTCDASHGLQFTQDIGNLEIAEGHATLAGRHSESDALLFQSMQLREAPWQPLPILGALAEGRARFGDGECPVNVKNT